MRIWNKVRLGAAAGALLFGVMGLHASGGAFQVQSEDFEFQHWPSWVPRNLPPSITVSDGVRFFRYIERSLGITPPDIAPKSGLFGCWESSDLFALDNSAQWSSATGTTTPYTIDVTTNTDRAEIETSHVAVKEGAIDYTVIGYLQEVQPGPGGFPNGYLLNSATTKTGDGFWTFNSLNSPSGYLESIDPVVHANIFSDGVSPLAVYYAGIPWQGTTTGAPSAIAVWKSSDRGFSWGPPVLVEVSNDASLQLDKVDMEVSWYSGTRGWVFVTYVRNSQLQPFSNQVMVARSTSGGTFLSPVEVAVGNRFNSPQILVNPFTGRVYVLWIDYNLDKVQMSFSDDNGSSWTSPETAASGISMLGGVGNDNFINGGVHSISVLQARFNSAANVIGVVWHARPFPGSDTNIYFARKNLQGWISFSINSIAMNDQFQPAIDFDNDGNFLVSYYDRSLDPQNIESHERWLRVDPNGVFLETGLVANSVATDPTDNVRRWIGDYQDVWFWNYNDVHGPRFHAIFHMGLGQGNVSAAAIRQP